VRFSAAAFVVGLSLSGPQALGVASADSTDVESVSAGAVDNDGQMSPAARSRGGENIACPHVEAALLRGMATRPSCRRVA